MNPRAPVGSTLVELLAALTLLAILAGLAAPALGAELRRARIRTTLDRLTADIYRARAIAVVRGARLTLSFEPPQGCATAYRLARRDDGAVLAEVRIPQRTGPCLTSNAPQAMSFDTRGMLVGSPRTIRARIGDQADSLTISIAGRVYRW